MTTRPWLLIDVDGVLNVSPTTDMLLSGWQPHDVLGPLDDRTYRLVVNPEHGEWLTGLGEFYRLAWCTTWGRVADERIAPLIGLPPLGHAVPLPVTFDEADLTCCPKAPYVIDWARGEPLAWIDDDVDARDQAALIEDGRAALVQQIDPSVGLTWPVVERLRAWAEEQA